MSEHIRAYADRVAEDYSERILDLLKEIRKLCIDYGLHCPDEPFDMSADDYVWALKVFRTEDENDLDNLVDVTIEIAEAHVYGDEPANGINFGLSIVEWGGRILGGYTPFNFTPECWVDAADDEAVADRWRVFESTSLGPVPILVKGDK